MKEIFISYSSNDLTQAETVRNVLEKNGLSCWMAPRDIPGGSNYTKEIPIAIRNCKIFVLILSKSAQSSHWVLKELDSAVNSGKVILPFMLEDCALNEEFNFLLTGAQRYAAYQKKAEAMETLISRIRGILDASSSVKDNESEEIFVNSEIPQPKAEMKENAAKKSAAKETVLDCFSDARCPACKSESIKELKFKVKCESLKEFLNLIWIPVTTVLFFFIGLIISSVFYFDLIYHFFEYSMLISLAFAIGGFVVGNYVSNTAIRRSRLRKGYNIICYRCNRCKKVFNHKITLD